MSIPSSDFSGVTDIFSTLLPVALSIISFAINSASSGFSVDAPNKNELIRFKPCKALRSSLQVFVLYDLFIDMSFLDEG